jgi:hypothetical protein
MCTSIIKSYYSKIINNRACISTPLKKYPKLFLYIRPNRAGQSRVSLKNIQLNVTNRRVTFNKLVDGIQAVAEIPDKS